MHRIGAILAVASAGALALAVTPVVAQDSGYRAIATGDYTAATQRLENDRKATPDRPELLLNLAAAYGLTGRNVEARAVYDKVLGLPAIDLDMRSGAVVSSHDVANRGLARLAPAIATR